MKDNSYGGKFKTSHLEMETHRLCGRVWEYKAVLVEMIMSVTHSKTALCHAHVVAITDDYRNLSGKKNSSRQSTGTRQVNSMD